ncbi:MAG: hypothetical protein P8Z30_03040 [Acidobacteriota bacterium]
MRKLIGASLFVTLFLAVSTPAQKLSSRQQEASPAAAALPLRQVILYKNGIGYFERSAKVDGSEDLHIDFTTGQLNDVLASLTATDSGDGHITSVRFNSIAPLNQRLRALHLPLNAQTTQSQFLNALRGTRVVVQSGSTSVTGKVLSVETFRKPAGALGETERVLMLSVITDAGDLRTFELKPGVSVQIADRDLRDEVAQYLKLIGSERAADVRRMTISDEGSGARTLTVSYISEVPVWKSTYRILLPSSSGEKPLIQGWAIVDNTLGEDWKNVQLSLVSGTPQSFVEDLSVPYYTRRPVMPLPHSVLLTPQTHEEALMPSAGPGHGGGVGGAVFGGVPGGQAGGVIGGVIGGVAGRPHPPQLRLPGSIAQSVVVNPGSIGKLQAQATGRKLSELFEYDIKNRVTIGRNQSALVPILQSQLDAEKVTLWNASDSVPLRALWLSNTSGLALDAGTFDVLDDGTFAGEGLFDTIDPGEKRLISYAADPAVQVTTKESSPPELVTRVRIAKGLMFTTREMRQTKTYRISDSDSKPRVVVIENPVRQGWKLVGSLKPDETTADFYRFKVTVKPRESSKLAVEEVHPETSQIALTNLTSNDVELLARQRRVTPAMETAFQKILEQKNALAAIEHEIQARQQDVANISKDQDRIRENMKALKGGSEEKQLLDRYVRELNTQEDRLSALRGQISGLKVKRDQAADRLNQTLEGITLDVSF